MSEVILKKLGGCQFEVSHVWQRLDTVPYTPFPHFLLLAEQQNDVSAPGKHQTLAPFPSFAVKPDSCILSAEHCLFIKLTSDSKVGEQFLI